MGNQRIIVLMLPDLANINTGHTAKFQHQINNSNIFSIGMSHVNIAENIYMEHTDTKFFIAYVKIKFN